MIEPRTVKFEFVSPRDDGRFEIIATIEPSDTSDPEGFDKAVDGLKEMIEDAMKMLWASVHMAIASPRTIPVFRKAWLGVAQAGITAGLGGMGFGGGDKSPSDKPPWESDYEEEQCRKKPPKHVAR